MEWKMKRGTNQKKKPKKSTTSLSRLNAQLIDDRNSTIDDITRNGNNEIERNDELYTTQA